mgnify:CR=1 FL=1
MNRFNGYAALMLLLIYIANEIRKELADGSYERDSSEREAQQLNNLFNRGLEGLAAWAVRLIKS